MNFKPVYWLPQAKWSALVLEAHRQGLCTEAEPGQFLGLTRLSRDRKMHRDIAGT